MPEAFSGKKEKARENQQQDIDELCRQIGQLIAEQDWLKKVFGQTLAARQLWIDSQDPLFSTRQQCHLLGINPSSLYYQPAGESEENLALMRRLDEQYTRTPCYGVLKMVATEERGELRAALPDRCWTRASRSAWADGYSSTICIRHIPVAHGRGRALDNIFVERLWRMVKYEHV